jgi:hypothetical protein
MLMVMVILLLIIIVIVIILIKIFLVSHRDILKDTIKGKENMTIDVGKEIWIGIEEICIIDICRIIRTIIS